MIHICFAFIRKYKALRDVGLKIDGRYDYRFDPETKMLSISEDENFPKRFWGRGVYSLAAIVGNNGAGKSTSMEFILKTLMYGANTHEIDGVLVYEQDGQLLVWGKDIKVDTTLQYSVVKDIPKITCFYYCGHFMPNVTYSDLRSTELAGGYNASDGWLLVKDIQSYSNISSIYMTLPLNQHLNYFVAQNNHRICTMLADEKVRNTIKEFCLPKYVQIGFNDSGWYAINEKNRQAEQAARQNKYPLNTEIIEIPPKKIAHTNARNRYLEQLIYYNFLNLVNEGIREKPMETMNMLTAWQDFKNNTDPILEQFKFFIEKTKCSRGLKTDLSAMWYMAKKVNELCSFFDNDFTQCFYLDTKTDGAKLKELVDEVLGKHLYLTAKFFDMYYSQELGSNTILSSGEQNLLDIFSRLYDALMISPSKFANADSKRLILLDEAEIGFHPDWQRRYINLVLDFLQTMVLVKPGVDFQVLISTHSPVLLSDIPDCCVNYMEAEEKGYTRNVSETVGRETFATNVFEQYRDSFFMKQGLIGEFAQRKLKAVQAAIEEDRVSDEILKIVRMIGDVRIKEYLLKEMASHDINFEIAYHEEKIKELKRRKECLNE